MTPSDDTTPCRGEFGGGRLEPYRQNGAAIVMSYRDTHAVLTGCVRCGYLRFDPTPDAAFLDRYYGEQYWDPAAIAQLAREEYGFPGYRLQTAEILRAWAQYGNPTRTPRIHDVGCGVGTLVHHLREQGIHATGSDVSQPAIAAGQALGNAALTRAGLDEYLAAHGDEPIDMFLLSHTLEHFPDPAAVLRVLRARLPRDGLVWLRVPNGLYCLARQRSWYDFQWLQYPNHIHYFTPRSLGCCFAAADLALAEIRATTREDDPDRLFAHLLGSAPSPAQRDSLLVSLAQTLQTSELQAVAVRADSPKRAAELSAQIDAVEPARA